MIDKTTLKGVSLMKILIFDADGGYAQSLEKLLVHRYTDRHEIVVADTPALAGEYCANKNFDIIILGVQDRSDSDPGMELLRLIRGSAIETPVVMISAVSGISIAVQCLKYGATDYIERSRTGISPVNSESKNGEAFIALIEKIRKGTRNNASSNLAPVGRQKILLIDANREFTVAVESHFAVEYEIESINDFFLAQSAAKDGSIDGYDSILIGVDDSSAIDAQCGLSLLKELVEIDPGIPVIFLSNHVNTGLIVESLQSGAKDFIEKVESRDETLKKIGLAMGAILKETAMELAGPERIASGMNSRVIDIIGSSRLMSSIRKEILEVAEFDIPVLVYGETGTGKGMVASAIHMASSRREKNYMELDCASIPESLFESELFGYCRGAFTGAAAERRGKMEFAHQGTLFLDEIENLSLDQQAKLLRVLDAKKIYPIGSEKPKHVDFRLICATNVDLQKMVQEGTFREDLFYRLSGYHIDLPPLRERGSEDIACLVDHYARQQGFIIFDDTALDILKRYSWPGNVRELRNLVKKTGIITVGGGAVRTDVLEKELGKLRQAYRYKFKHLLTNIVHYYNGNLPEFSRDCEDAAVLEMYDDYNGNITKIAERVYKETPDDTRNYRNRVRKILERNKHLLAASM
ncbi:MAG: response regulator [bacterium]|nr:response regulator [bacterium]